MKYFDVNYSTDDRKSTIKIKFPVLKNLYLKDTCIIPDLPKVFVKTLRTKSVSQYLQPRSDKQMSLYFNPEETVFLSDR